MPALSYVCGASDHPLWAVTIGRELDQVAAGHPGNQALVSRHQGIRLTYAELHAAAEEAARAFLAHGVAKGERVGIWSPNRAEWVVVQYATAKVGAILVNVNPAFVSFYAHDTVLPTERDVREHGAICEAIRRGDADEARRLMLLHLQEEGELRQRQPESR